MIYKQFCCCCQSHLTHVAHIDVIGKTKQKRKEESATAQSTCTTHACPTPYPHLTAHRFLGRELKLADDGIDLFQASVEVQELTVAPEDVPLLIFNAHVHLVHVVLG